MRQYTDFIFENQVSNLGVLTNSNKERKALLIKFLHNKKLDAYIDTLNDMLKDVKTKSLLEDGFGGKLGDTKLNFSVCEIPVINLRPTQSEIDVNNSIDHPFKNPDKLKETFIPSDKLVICNSPLVTFRKNYIIDGHHRWSQAYAFNPDAKMLCYNYDGDLSPIQMIKAVQATIAAVKAKRNDKSPIDSNKVRGQNLFDDKWDKDEIIKHIDSIITNNFINKFILYKPELNTTEKIEDYISENLINLKSNNYPEIGAPNRGEMPVSKDGRTKENDKSTYSPSTSGSALNKLAHKEFVKNATN